MCGYYAKAQICVQGHTISSDMHGNLSKNKKFCDKCGAETIDKCQDCNSPINGRYITPGHVIFSNYVTPNYCSNCGKPYPWTIKKIEAVVKLAQLEEVLTEEEILSFASDVEVISSDSPATIVSTRKILKIGAKLSVRAWAEIRLLLIEIASETAKKIIMDKT
ncbi:MAG: DUF2321 domain-containing protein [Ignavibacteriales bacterium]|mgnify:CR=1 FL=1|nr:hypothetical protein [Ignavibacteriaceae bacterium]MBW7873367.1 DUF2321 domain-containing protein [Ignavibacteria bacterium]MBZ0197821.1 DUF2321 domain-containing protein [Ignavibacteriaceae bacterium]MCZ2142057.1 DUF2321 domain-containing protein [Ignavibacteriales bacterium]WKZ71749.1 MAG: DUF2321 domain-containing protein [Ignavibacteriaceae bacterium]